MQFIGLCYKNVGRGDLSGNNGDLVNTYFININYPIRLLSPGTFWSDSKAGVNQINGEGFLGGSGVVSKSGVHLVLELCYYLVSNEAGFLWIILEKIKIFISKVELEVGPYLLTF